jgi:hypothetical protein
MFHLTASVLQGPCLLQLTGLRHELLWKHSVKCMWGLTWLAAEVRQLQVPLLGCLEGADARQLLQASSS